MADLQGLAAPAGSGGSQFVYVVRGGIVRFVGVGTKQVTSDAGVLSGYVARAGLR
jgi:hypothetical protein